MSEPYLSVKDSISYVMLGRSQMCHVSASSEVPREISAKMCYEGASQQLHHAGFGQIGLAGATCDTGDRVLNVPALPRI
jgi:hypothetical protein